MNQKPLLFVLALFFCLSINAQDRKFDLGISLTPNYSFNIMKNDGGMPIAAEEYFRSIETGKYAFSGSLFLEYKQNQKISFQLGLGYQNIGEKTIKLDIHDTNNIIVGLTPEEAALISHASFNYNRHNLEIPFYFKYKLNKTFYALIGTSVLINIANYTTSFKYYKDGSIVKNPQLNKDAPFRTFNFSTNLGFGMDLVDNDSFTLFIHPNFHYSFLGPVKNASLRRFPMTLGVSTGLIIH